MYVQFQQVSVQLCCDFIRFMKKTKQIKNLCLFAAFYCVMINGWLLVRCLTINVSLGQLNV